MPEPRPNLDQAVRLALAAANSPALRRQVENAAGIRLDKVTEVVLSHVRCQEGSELRMSDVACRLGVELSSVSRKVQKMELAGLVVRIQDPDDARAFRIRITRSGAESLETIRSARSDFVDRAIAHWPEEHKAMLADLLTRLASDIDAACEGGS